MNISSKIDIFLVDVSDIFYFLFLLGGGERGVRGAGRGGTIFHGKPQEWGGVSPAGGSGGRGPGGCLRGIWGGGGKIFFFSGLNSVYSRVAPVRFGWVTVWGWNGSSGSGFRFRRFLYGRFYFFCVSVQFNTESTVPVSVPENFRSGGSSSAFGS